MITAFLHVVVDVVNTCISATWSSAQIFMKHANNTVTKNTSSTYTDLFIFVCFSYE